MKKCMIFICSLVLSGIAFATASIDGVIVRQQWPWNNKVNIDFVLSDPADGVSDVAVTLKNGMEEIKIAPGSLSGQTENLKRGAHRLVWDPTVGATEGTPKVYTDFAVDVTLVDTSKKFMIIDFGGSQGAGAQSESYAVSFTNVVPENGWFADNTYKDQKLVLRWIPAGSFTMGSPETEPSRNACYETQKPVTLTKGFYIGVVPTTGYQVLNVLGAFPPGAEGSIGAVMRMCYTDLRGENAHTSAVWPNVERGSFFGELNAKASVQDVLPGYRFDLPSAAQLEYATRAGTTTTWYNGTNYDPSCETDPDNYEPNLAKIGVYKYNSGSFNTRSPEQWWGLVGVLEPNAWGLYNIIGTVDVLVRDTIRYANSGVVIDSTPITGVDCVFFWDGADPHCWRKGGHRTTEAKNCRVTTWRDAGLPSAHHRGDNNAGGFRIVCTYFGN